MMFFILYVIFGSILGTLIQRLLPYNPKNDVPKQVLSILGGCFWPAAGPAFICYILVNKLVDKFTKV